MTNLLADPISRHKLFKQRMSKRIETSNNFFSLSTSTAERAKDERVTKFTTMIFKVVQSVSQKEEKKKRENKRTVSVPENSKMKKLKEKRQE